MSERPRDNFDLYVLYRSPSVLSSLLSSSSCCVMVRSVPFRCVFFVFFFFFVTWFSKGTCDGLMKCADWLIVKRILENQVNDVDEMTCEKRGYFSCRDIFDLPPIHPLLFVRKVLWLSAGQAQPKKKIRERPPRFCPSFQLRHPFLLVDFVAHVMADSHWCATTTQRPQMKRILVLCMV